MKTYSFGELNQDAQKRIIEGHTEYMNTIYDKQHSYLEVTDDLTKKDYKYYEGGDVAETN